MIGVTAGAVAGCLMMLVMWSSSWLGPGIRPRKPFALASEWYGRPVTRHRATPSPGRDWTIW